MAELVLQLDAVSKVYGHGAESVPALDDVSFTVAAGRVVALVGRNGAGKTTLLRLVAGLARPDRGTIEVAGRRVPDASGLACLEMGCSIEGAGFLGGLSGLANLDLIARRHGLGGQPVTSALRRCGLGTEAALRPVSTYSLGMRQRLGLAAALIGEPRLLVLDEPTNGLDPAGIAWMRDVLHEHAAQGRAALVSSHLLDEVERVADEVVILDRGRVARAGPLRDILDSSTAEVRLRVTGEGCIAAAVLRSAGLPATGSHDEVALCLPHGQLAQVTRVLAGAGIGVVRMEPTTGLLEAAVLDAARVE
jgi:ABC-2 type transport system ATP-binding protein